MSIQFAIMLIYVHVETWNEMKEFISQDSVNHDTTIIKTASSPDPYVSSEPQYRTPPPRYGSAKARVGSCSGRIPRNKESFEKIK